MSIATSRRIAGLAARVEVLEASLDFWVTASEHAQTTIKGMKHRIADLEAQLAAKPTGKRGPGRPRKLPRDAAAGAPGLTEPDSDQLRSDGGR